jgi:hypothetical protein
MNFIRVRTAEGRVAFTSARRRIPHDAEGASVRYDAKTARQLSEGDIIEVTQTSKTPAKAATETKKTMPFTKADGATQKENS